jgi:hypothetical protein
MLTPLPTEPVIAGPVELPSRPEPPRELDPEGVIVPDPVGATVVIALSELVEPNKWVLSVAVVVPAVEFVLAVAAAC